MEAAVATIADLQLKQLQSQYTGSEIQTLPDGTQIVSIPDVKLPSGWNQASTTIRFLVPVGYPAGQPDCFWADATLRLANESLPLSSGVQPIPHLGVQHLWFSWHVTAWNPSRNSLLTYIRVIEDRLRTPQ